MSVSKHTTRKVNKDKKKVRARKTKVPTDFYTTETGEEYFRLLLLERLINTEDILDPNHKENKLFSFEPHQTLKVKITKNKAVPPSWYHDRKFRKAIKNFLQAVACFLQNQIWVFSLNIFVCSQRLRLIRNIFRWRHTDRGDTKTSYRC